MDLELEIKLATFMRPYESSPEKSNDLISINSWNGSPEDSSYFAEGCIGNELLSDSCQWEYKGNNTAQLVMVASDLCFSDVYHDRKTDGIRQGYGSLGDSPVSGITGRSG